VRLVVYGFGGLGFAYYLMKNDPNRRDSFSFLTRGYREEMFFWDLVTTLRKIVIVLVSLFATAPLQLFFTTWILLVSWLGQHFFHPYESKLASKMDSSSLWVLLFTVTVGMLFYTNAIRAGTAAAAAVTFLLVLINFIAVAAFLLLALKQSLVNNPFAKRISNQKSQQLQPI